MGCRISRRALWFVAWSGASGGDHDFSSEEQSKGLASVVKLLEEVEAE